MVIETVQILGNFFINRSHAKSIPKYKFKVYYNGFQAAVSFRALTYLTVQ